MDLKLHQILLRTLSLIATNASLFNAQLQKLLLDLLRLNSPKKSVPLRREADTGENNLLANSIGRVSGGGHTE